MLTCASGCGGGVPLLHDAHTLPEGETAVGAGFSGTFAAGEANDVAARARQTGTGGINAAQPGDVARATAVLMTLAPAVAPWVSARVGIRGNNEAGITYTGRAIAVDARHAFYLNDAGLALSVGIGTSWVTGSPGEEPPGAGEVRVDWRSAGVDVPVIIGWRSVAGIVSIWAGPRGGVERVSGDATLPPDNSVPSNIDLWRFYAGGVVGLGVGFRHVHGTIEIDAAYQSLTGTAGPYDVSVRGLTLAPAAGLVATF
jgi:hypothetical protein